ncbi:MAG: S1 family peptidase [Methanobacterium sp.]
MRTSIKALFLALIFLIILAFAGEINLTDILDNSSTFNSSSPNSSVVYIQNGVSGAVTIKDPSTNIPLTMNVDYSFASGSGVIISKDGYIITAFHVVGDPQTLETSQKLKRMSEGDINYYIEQAAVTEYLARYNPQLASQLGGNSNIQNNRDITNLFIQNNLINVNSAKQTIKVKTDSGLSRNLEAQLIDTGNPANDEDVALLKVNRDNLQALQISSKNPIGAEVSIYGYPGTRDQNSINLASSAGSVVREVRNTKGILYYEANAPASNGYSGGPVLDTNNRILGIVIYSIQSRGFFRSRTSSNDSLFLSSNYLIGMCKKNNVPVNIS